MDKRSQYTDGAGQENHDGSSCALWQWDHRTGKMILQSSLIAVPIGATKGVSVSSFNRQMLQPASQPHSFLLLQILFVTIATQDKTLKYQPLLAGAELIPIHIHNIAIPMYHVTPTTWNVIGLVHDYQGKNHKGWAKSWLCRLTAMLSSYEDIHRFLPQQSCQTAGVGECTRGPA